LAVSAERSVARFRLISAIAVLPASIYLLASPQPSAAKALASIGVLVSLGWIAAFFLARARVRDRAAFHLDLADEGMTLCLGKATTTVGWSDVRDVDVDEERLMVVIGLRDGRTVDIPPVWEGTGLYELAAMVASRRDGASRPDDG
jgi:hypothetical protein